MWFVGLIGGGFIGALVGSGPGLFFGAVLGAIAGATLRGVARASTNSRVDEILTTVNELRDRVSALERRAGISTAAPGAVAERVEPVSTPVATSEDLAELARVNAAVEEVARSGAAQPATTRESGPSSTTREIPVLARSSAEKSRQQESTRRTNAQAIGAVVGALIGAFGGIAGFLIGALFGWAAVVAVQSHNRRVERDNLRYGAERRAQAVATVPDA